MFSGKSEQWKMVARALKRPLNHQWADADSVVRIVSDPSCRQGFRQEVIAPVGEILGKELPSDWEYTFDFGRYCVGYPVIVLDYHGIFDAPFRLEYKLAETPYECQFDFAEPGLCSLSRSWLQDGSLVLDEPASEIRFSRRGAFRFLTLKSVSNSNAYKAVLKGIRCDMVSAADFSQIPAVEPDSLDRRIDRIGLITLASCMQDVFEDGPKRDRRLWLGDLRIQALANYNSFRNFNLVKRCLYLFAAAADPQTGQIPGCIYRDHPHLQGGCFIDDFAVLFGDILLDYIIQSNDVETGHDLFEISLHQCRLALENFESGCFKDTKKHWLFVDWRDGLQKECAEHCTVIYGMKRVYQLAEYLGCEDRLTEYPNLIRILQKNGFEKWYDAKQGCFVANGQSSYASQIWAAYAGLLPEKETVELLIRMLNSKRFLAPGGPFLYNQLILVLTRYGLQQKARDVVRNYWGKMIESGADTFWEFFIPENPMYSAYGNAAINSHCHAWSTPVIRI